jgi:YD repeat-containing protein
MRISNEVQRSQPWCIHSIAHDFALEDVWRLPAVSGGKDDFTSVVEMVADSDPVNADSRATRLLWDARDRLGAWFDLGRISSAAGGQKRLPIPGTPEWSLADRLPQDLRGSADGVHFAHLPFVPLYRTQDEFAAEISNRTVHGVMHLAWVGNESGDNYEAQMAVYVKPRGRFGRMYMAFIKPFRYLIVYPALERQLARSWSRRQTG